VQSPRSQIWLLDQTAKRYSQRPSHLLGLTDELVALDFDQAVAQFGIWLEDRLKETKPIMRGKLVIGHKPRHKLADLLTDRPRQGLIDIGALAGMAGIRVEFDG
jgi:hypothetical protein